MHQLRTSVAIKVALVSCTILLSLYMFGNYMDGKGIFPKYLQKPTYKTNKNQTIRLIAFQTLAISDETISQEDYSEKFLFHKGKNSIGGDLFHVEGLSIDQLKVLCYQSIGCVGFTTNGYLKRVIQPYNKWTDYIEEDMMTQGLFTLDTNYCVLDEGHNCPVGATCLHGFNGTYTCDSIIHIGMSIDSKVFDGLAAVLQSIIEHSSNNRIMIHIITNTTDEVIVKDRVDCSVTLPPNIMIDYKTFDLPDSVRSLITVDPDAQYLANFANYARFYLADIFPNVSYLIYLDADLIVKKDISTFWNEVVNTDKLLVVIPRGHERCYLNYTMLLKLYFDRYEIEFEKLKCSGFNAGVFGINLRMWREKNILEEVKYWMKENKEKGLWHLGTQPIMYVISNENWKGISKRWNMQELYYPDVSLKLFKAGVVHWSGADKPWGKRPKYTRRDRAVRKYDRLWTRYRRDVCSNNGVCRRDSDMKKSTAFCVCNHGYTGRLCNKRKFPFLS